MPLPVLVHNWDYDKVLSDTATCTTDGKKTYGCSDSGCNAQITVLSPAKGHVFSEWNVKKTATCTEEGEQERSCTCGEKEKMIIPAAGHIQALEWQKTEKEHWNVCTVEGCKAVIAETKAAHSNGTDSICDICGYEEKKTETEAPESETNAPESETNAPESETNAPETEIKLPQVNTVLTDPVTKEKYVVTESTPAEKKVTYAKTNNKSLTKVIIPDTVTIDGITYKITAIGNGAFKGCKNLKSVTIGKNITTIGMKAFYKCVSLTKIRIPASVKSIGKGAFFGCSGLKTVKFGKNVRPLD